MSREQDIIDAVKSRDPEKVQEAIAGGVDLGSADASDILSEIGAHLENKRVRKRNHVCDNCDRHECHWDLRRDLDTGELFYLSVSGDEVEY